MHTLVFSAPDPAAGCCQPTPPLETPGHSQESLAPPHVGHYSFLLASGVHKVLFVPSTSLFPQSCGSSVIKSHWPPKSNSLGRRGRGGGLGYREFLVPLPDPQVGKSVVGPRTFLTVGEFLWYNCSSVCGSSAWRLCGCVSGHLLQKALCHMVHVPGPL